jgi:hypothetical protein
MVGDPAHRAPSKSAAKAGRISSRARTHARTHARTQEHTYAIMSFRRSLMGWRRARKESSRNSFCPARAALATHCAHSKLFPRSASYRSSPTYTYVIRDSLSLSLSISLLEHKTYEGARTLTFYSLLSLG